MKILHIKQKILFDSFGNFAYIAKKPSKKITASSIPLQLILEDDFKQSFSVELISIIPFDSVIPEICAYHALGCPPEKAFTILQKRHEIDHPSELAYYLYKTKRL